MQWTGVVTGLAAESACLEGLAAERWLRLRCAGARPAVARAAAEALVAEGCRALISFGLAGGLAADLAPGSIVLADAVVTADGRHFTVDAGWQHRLHAALGTDFPVATGTIVGVDAPVTTPAAKHALGQATGALACDMESHRLAAVALTAGLPFLVVRAIGDAATRALPAWLGTTIEADGRPRLDAVLAGLARRPGDLPALIKIAFETRRSLAALRRLAVVAGPLLRFDLGAEPAD